MKIAITLLLMATCVIAAEPASQPAIFKTVVCPISKDNPRNGEGDIAVLNDGRLLLVYSHWTRAGAAADDAPADIRGRTSSDGGRTWSDDFVMIPNDAMNLMSVSLLRLHNDELMLVYGRRHSNADMSFHARFSSDEGKSWSADSLVTTKRGYQAVNNARVIQLQSRRLLAPAFFCRGKTWKDDYYFFGVVYHSDNNGRTWRDGEQRIDVDASSLGTDEPAVVELTDGRVMMLIRTDTGRIWRCYSRDGGVTWSKPAATDLASPSSPATIRRIPSTGDLLLVWNNTPPRPRNRGQPRNPLTTAISTDEGKTWKHVRNLEDTEGGNYCYASMTFNGRDVILSYYERGALKVCIADVDWFYR